MKNNVNIKIDFSEMLEKVCAETENSVYEETFVTASRALSGEQGYDSVYDVAFALHNCDENKKMPASVKAFLTTVYQLGIDEGHPICMNNLGTLYYTDRAGMYDRKKARKYYTMAADLGYSLAAGNLGYIYYYGFDCDVDYEQAYKYFTMAALCGEIEALYKVGDMFRNGYYVKKSGHTAFVLYNRALSMFTDAEDCRCGGNIMKRMGDVFCEGIGVDINYDTALMFYQRAEGLFYSQIRNGDPFADKDLEYAIKMQAKLRKAVAKTLPKRDWEVQ